MKNEEKKTSTKIIENKISLSFREHADKRVLFRLFNTKKSKSKSFAIYEKAKLSTRVRETFNNEYRTIDYDYDTTKNNRFKRVNLLVDIPSFIDKNKIPLYKDLLNSNSEFYKSNKVSNEILENHKYFENLINNLK
jgi:hypothetical protein